MSRSGLTEDNGSNVFKDLKMVVDEGFAKCEERLERLEADFREIKTLLQKLLAKKASSLEARHSTLDSPAKLSQSESMEDITKIYSASPKGSPLQQPQHQDQTRNAPPIYSNEKPQFTQDTKLNSGQTFDAARNPLQQPQPQGQPGRAPPIYANEETLSTKGTESESSQSFVAARNPLQQPQQKDPPSEAQPISADEETQSTKGNKSESGETFDAACLKEKNEIIKSYENDELPEYLSKLFTKTQNASRVQKGNPNSVLIKALEKFLTRSEEPGKEFEALKISNAPQVVCGKELKRGEDCYSCIDCAQYTNCVLCSECFHNSIHRKHTHEVRGSGDGYCVCGDFEYWKDGHACDLHKKPDQLHEQVNDPQNILEIGLKHRAERLFDAVMSFSHKALTSSEDGNISASEDSLSGNNSLYCTMLSNTGSFAADQVLNILINILTDRAHEDIGAIIEELKEKGRACIYIGEKRECEQIANRAVEADAIIAGLTENGRACIHKGEKSESEQTATHAVDGSAKTNSPGMEIKVMNYKAVADQEIAHELLQWIKKIINISDGLKSVLYRIMWPSGSGGPLSLIEKFLLDDTKISEASRLVCHQLYIDVVIRNKERHGEFAGIFTKCYPALVSSFLKAKHRISSDCSITSLTFQLYAPSSVVKKLVGNHKVIEVILNTILTESQAWQENGALKFKDPQDVNDYGLLLQSFHDLRNILSWCLVSFEWTDESRTAVLDGLDLLLKFMSLVQEMELAKLPLKGKKDLETRHAPFVIQRHLKDCSNLFVKLCSSDWEVHRRSYSMVLDRLLDRTRKSATVSIGGHTAECFTFDVNDKHEKTTIFLPIHRLFAALYIKLPDDIIYTSECFASLNKKISLSDVLEYPLRVIVRLAQVEAKVWNKKSYFVEQMVRYKSREHNGGTLDRDIQILQIAASLMEPNEFMIHILNKFNLTWILTDSTPTTKKKYRKYIIEKFLLLLISVVGERFVEGIGCVDQDTVLKREIVHTLAKRDRSLSDLKKKFSVQIDEKTNFEENLKTVASVGEDNNSEVICKLRTEYYDWFNPCFHHYNSSKRLKAEEAQRKIRKDKGLSSALSIPKPPALCKRFTSILELLKCDIMRQIMSAVVSDVYHKTTKVFKKCHLEKVLNLMTIGFHEDKSLYDAGDISLPFVKALQDTKAGKEEKTIMDLLQQYMNEKTSSNQSIKDLCEYVLGFWGDLLKLQNSCTVQ